MLCIHLESRTDGLFSILKIFRTWKEVSQVVMVSVSMMLSYVLVKRICRSFLCGVDQAATICTMIVILVPSILLSNL